MNALSHALLPQNGFTSLILAANGGHVEVASLLLQRGADIEAKDGVRINTLRDFRIFFFSFSDSASHSFSICVSLSLPFTLLRCLFLSFSFILLFFTSRVNSPTANFYIF